MEKDFKFKKSLGQNFITERNIFEKIVKAANIFPKSLVIEIGSGSGGLTKELSRVAEKVISYEIDERLRPVLIKEFEKIDNIEIIYDDFLKRDLKEDLKNYNYSNIYVVANLPYYITTPIIAKIIDSKVEIKGMTIMVQKEFAERILAKPKTKAYGSLTVFLNYYFDIKKEFTVSKNCFVPKPKVDSVVLSFKKKPKNCQVKDEQLLFELIRDSFRFKRKNIRNNLKNYDLIKISEVLKQYDYDLNVRSEQLPLEVFIDLANNIKK